MVMLTGFFLMSMADMQAIWGLIWFDRIISITDVTETDAFIVVRLPIIVAVLPTPTMAPLSFSCRCLYDVLHHALPATSMRQ